MKNRKYILLTAVLIIFIINIDIVIKSVLDSSILFFTKVFVSIFPFIILSDILIFYDYHIFLSRTIGKFISKIFNIDANGTIVIILSLLTSQPGNSIYIKNLLENGETDNITANRLLTFTYFPSISFIVGAVGVSYFNSIKIGVILLLINYLYNFTIGIFLRKSTGIVNKIEKYESKSNLIETIKSSIMKAVNSSFIILGNIIIFTILINLFKEYVNISPTFNALISGFLELTNGINLVSELDISLKLKVALTSLILNFSGLSIIFQSVSILSNYKLNIKKILIIKLIFSLLFFLATYWFCC
jgi:sporulation integral membrane protein YlbJ